ncbi:hypothetical protein I6B53_08225 [Schaalia sp. 19OD2882]|uniref:hypothetical protein n=1 Tax=Schaalia sp. 19OD2882 TaxID=2794089 RepID=UPI001C1E9E3B|nr:hypothetical protein [Schaalia sp. 19OD2882]QWW19100.1 hypothetical protein I6B53_08225 [Schaalia sp. 19OD2882]
MELPAADHTLQSQFSEHFPLPLVESAAGSNEHLTILIKSNSKSPHIPGRRVQASLSNLFCHLSKILLCWKVRRVPQRNIATVVHQDVHAAAGTHMIGVGASDCEVVHRLLATRRLDRNNTNQLTARLTQKISFTKLPSSHYILTTDRIDRRHLAEVAYLRGNNEEAMGHDEASHVRWKGSPTRCSPRTWEHTPAPVKARSEGPDRDLTIAETANAYTHWSLEDPDFAELFIQALLKSSRTDVALEIHLEHAKLTSVCPTCMTTARLFHITEQSDQATAAILRFVRDWEPRTQLSTQPLGIFIHRDLKPCGTQPFEADPAPPSLILGSDDHFRTGRSQAFSTSNHPRRPGISSATP